MGLASQAGHLYTCPRPCPQKGPQLVECLVASVLKFLIFEQGPFVLFCTGSHNRQLILPGQVL